MFQSLNGLLGYHFFARFLHVFFGVIWIGMLYYFNYVQGAFMAETTEAVAKSQVTQKLLPRAMWWFRWGAMWTFVSGLVMLAIRGHIDVAGTGIAVLNTPYWISILTGAAMGTLMFLNVWLVIWPRQKAVIANAVTVAAGGAPNPQAPLGAARALVASRTNTLFSIPLIFFMLATNHLGFSVDQNSQFTAYWCSALGIILAIEINALVGKTGPLTTVKGVITSGFVLTAVFVVLLQALM